MFDEIENVNGFNFSLDLIYFIVNLFISFNFRHFIKEVTGKDNDVVELDVYYEIVE